MERHTIHTSTSKRFTAARALKVCHKAVVDSHILQHYLHVKHNETYVRLRDSRNLSHGGKFCLSVLNMCLLSVIGAIKQCPQWVVMGDIVVSHDHPLKTLFIASIMDYATVTDKYFCHGVNSKNCITFIKVTLSLICK